MRQGTWYDGQRTLFPWPLLKAISFGHAHPERLPASSLFSVFVRSVQDLPLGAEIDLCCLPLPLSLSLLLPLLRFLLACLPFD